MARSMPVSATTARGQGASVSEEGEVIVLAPSAEKQLQIDYPASGDVPADEERLQARRHHGQVCPSERRLVCQVTSQPLSPGLGHDGVVGQVGPISGPEPFEKPLPPPTSDDFGQGGVDGLGGRLGPK